jgi:hypothetical protein
LPETFTCDIGAITGLVIMPDPDFGTVARDADESDNIYADEATQLPGKCTPLRHMQFSVVYEGTSKDDLLAWENALRMELSKATNTLKLQPRNATNAVYFDMVRQPTTSCAFDYAYDHLDAGIANLHLVTRPWGRPDAATALFSSSAQTSPALVDLGTLTGQGDPRLTLTVTRDWGTASDGLGMQYVVCALCNGDAVTDYFFEAESGDMTGDWDSDATVLNPSGGAAAKLPSATTTNWTALTGVVSPTTLPQGRYRVLVRAKTTSDKGDNYIGMRKITATARDPKTTRVPDTFWQWHDLGDWVNYGGNALRLYGKSVTGSLYIDCVLMVPVDWGYVWYTDDDEDTDNVTFGWLAHEMVYENTAGAAGSAAARVAGHGLKVPLSGFKLLVMVEPKGSDPAADFVLDGSYYPRWEMWRP